MKLENRSWRLRTLLSPFMLVIAACLISTGCGGVTQWLASDGQPKVGTKAFEKQVEADAFPTAAEAGL